MYQRIDAQDDHLVSLTERIVGTDTARVLALGRLFRLEAWLHRHLGHPVTGHRNPEAGGLFRLETGGRVYYVPSMTYDVPFDAGAVYPIVENDLFNDVARCVFAARTPDEVVAQFKDKLDFYMFMAGAGRAYPVLPATMPAVGWEYEVYFSLLPPHEQTRTHTHRATATPSPDAVAGFRYQLQQPVPVLPW